MLDLTQLISNINWLAVIVLTVLSFVLGALWHTQFLFGKAWKTENNYDNSGKKANFPLIFGGTAVFHFIAMTALSAMTSGTGAKYGFHAGLIIGFVWIVPSLGGTYLFANRSIKLLAIEPDCTWYFSRWLDLFLAFGSLKNQNHH